MNLLSKFNVFQNSLRFALFNSLALIALLLAVTVQSGCQKDARKTQTSSDRAQSHLDWMPGVEDYTHMWWAEGFPSLSPEAPWWRCIQTGRYAMVLDTETLRIPHLGRVAAGMSYAECARADNRAWQRLPSADLELNITANGKTYRCTSGGKWKQFSGPRLIESGRFVQRADVTDLGFTAEDGTRLNVEARFETVAWPDRLTSILAARPGELWRDASMEIRLTTPDGTREDRWESPKDQSWSSNDTREVWVAWSATDNVPPDAGPVTVQAFELPSGTARPVAYHPARGWYRVNLDGITPIVPEGREKNDGMERVKLVLTNPAAVAQTARLLFEKNGKGIRQRIGSPITGITAVLRDVDGQPTGIQVQLSKNWHTRPEGGMYAGVWFHGFSQVRVPAETKIELELTLAYGHWGGVAAASHAQLSLIGWGSNQLWDESALGSWGESICYEPDQVQAKANVLDVRPVMVRSMNKNLPWHWTHNVGGGDWFRLFDSAGKRIQPTRMRTAYERQGPCLTEVTYAGRTGRAIEQSATVSIARTDDVLRGIYRLRMDVKEAMNFSRFVLFQMGADTYSYTGERKIALGNEDGLLREWSTQWGGNTYRTKPAACTGRVPWISLHEAVSRARPTEHGAWANRGLVIRAWDARLGGKKAAPWIAERGVKAHGRDTSTIDILPPPGITSLNRGDFVEATIEHIIVPQFVNDYFGPSESLRTALGKWENTWRMIHREATGNDRSVKAKTGKLERLYPDVRIQTSNDRAEFTLAGGLGYVPITFTGLTAHKGYILMLDGQRIDQSIHGNDYWQTDYDPSKRCWTQTFNIPISPGRIHSVRFKKAP